MSRGRFRDTPGQIWMGPWELPRARRPTTKQGSEAAKKAVEKLKKEAKPFIKKAAEELSKRMLARPPRLGKHAAVLEADGTGSDEVPAVGKGSLADPG
ncbi:unnamed protein product [Prorocentrum cordatum]|uniref:Cilia- and flagella-associated protein 126 n=1 Tax=Prorocentrum cordatum TaxID=2364126 RepID=A0ABN9UKD3_9DINO|nr:unnamed protein product [Polarella glacialis]